MFDLFFDIFSYRENTLTRLDPRVKIVTALTAVVCILLSTRMLLPLGACILCVSSLVMLRIPLRLIAGRLAIPMMFVLMLLALQSFHGIPFAFLLGAKVMGSLSVMILLSMVTPAHKVFSALRAMRVPRGWVELAMLMYRSIFVLLEHASEAACAQRVRLGHLGIRRTLSSMGTLAGSVFLRSLDQAKATHDAMTLRGYTGAIPSDSLPTLTRKEIIPSLVVCLVIAGMFLIQEWR